MRYVFHVFLLLSALCLGYGCSDGDHQEVAVALYDGKIPMMVTHDVTMLISDSGIIKYRAITPTWVRFGDDTQIDSVTKGAYQYFPDGIEFEQIDTVFEATETIVADTAYNWESRQMWHLIRNVSVTSRKGEKFQTNDLYWDMKKHTVYSDSFIHIERADNIIEGYGFTSTDDFTKYEIKQTNGIFPLRENAAATSSATTTAKGEESDEQ
ncbi:MAG: LPS export ABC transporter periplasmic protein LptC [Bacteroidales bacterium]|jgi:LPS export ABC transporter protein LptC|nr:LPS export ABC transporter periplasmic protein LptC [Bacteroidales bacterium]MCR5360675.1 LPS export ABC transporter periplasmic protein LptC [Bacteroidales bacterium]